MRVQTTLTLMYLGIVAGCADQPLPSAPPEAMRPLAAVTRQFPGEDAGPPFYSPIERLFIPHTEEWAAIVFVRDPACIPPGFNLLDLLAVPAAFGCPATVEGHITYKNGPPPIDAAPIHALLRGTGAVPIWFVAWSALEAAIADDLLTLPEIAAMPSLRVGSASSFQMSQHPGATRPQGLGNGKIEMVARGLLEDGRSFQFQVREMGVEQESVLRHIRIEFR